MGGKGVAGIHATGDSYHGGRGRRGAGGPGAPQPARRRRPPRPCSRGGATRSAAAGGGRGMPMPCTVSDAQKQERPAEPLWPWWDKAIGGYFKFHWLYPTPITVKIDDPKSPITAAFKGKSFNTIDEVYTFNESSFSREQRARAHEHRLRHDERLRQGPRSRAAQGPRLRAELDSRRDRAASSTRRSAITSRSTTTTRDARAHPRRDAVRARRPEGRRQPEQEVGQGVQDVQRVPRGGSGPGTL